MYRHVLSRESSFYAPERMHTSANVQLEGVLADFVGKGRRAGGPVV